MINASSTTTLVSVILTLTFLPTSVSCFLSTTPSSLCVGIVPLSQQQPHFPMTQPPKQKKCIDSITTLYGVLSRSTILSSKERHNKQRPKKANVKNNNTKFPMTTDFLLGAIEEALYQQNKILQALSKNEKRTTQVNDDSIISSSDVATTTSTANSRTVIRRNEITTMKHKLLSLKTRCTSITKSRHEEEEESNNNNKRKSNILPPKIRISIHTSNTSKHMEVFSSTISKKRIWSSQRIYRSTLYISSRCTHPHWKRRYIIIACR
mmetsp:Transcript_26361/g.39170  ORF Transcript_26361/g.39170 Transcript_26361/m.39170 type:complete len:265 (+) Transcript_26361:234-1028(+)